MQFLFPPPKTNVNVTKGGELKIIFLMHKTITMTKKLTPLSQKVFEYCNVVAPPC